MSAEVGEKKVRRRAAVFTLFSLDILAGREGTRHILERQESFGVKLTDEEIEAAREVRTLIPEPEGWKFAHYIGDKHFRGDFNLSSYRTQRSFTLFEMSQFLESSQNVRNDELRGQLEEDPSEMPFVQFGLNRNEDGATQALLNTQASAEAAFRYASAGHFVEEVINPEAELKDEDPYWIHPPDKEKFEVIPLIEDVIYQMPPNVREVALKSIIYQETGYVEEDNQIKLAVVLRVQGTRMLYDVYSRRVEYYIAHFGKALQEMEGKV